MAPTCPGAGIAIRVIRVWPGAPAPPLWLLGLSQVFKDHRLERPGWFLEQHRDRLRVVCPEAIPAAGAERRLVPATLERLIEQLQQRVVGEQPS